ncbi:MAG: NERD domain-containing protein [Lachnospiraceae bacterium]|nr:NERD domain-containing protein [Lachnospiraceae bacterium]
MEILSKKTTGDLKKEIELQIKLASYGEMGEKNIAFELKNSGIDMYILHDIYLEFEDLSAQIDFLVITKRHLYVIECKNLIGNIEIDNNGNFIRSFDAFGKKIKEGIYSPITQNERHLNVIKNIRMSTINALLKPIFEKNFSNNYRSIVCLANPKTILNDKFAKKEIRDMVIRADQLIRYIKEIDNNERYTTFSDTEMKEYAQFFLSMSKPNKSDYSKKYNEMLERVEKEKKKDAILKDSITNNKICPKCGKKLVIRVSKKGEFAGKQFYGCSGYPKCFYVENL